MSREMSIVIGCDDKSALSAILKSMHRISLFTHTIISAARVSDLISIAKSVSPDLIILFFRNNQLVLNDCLMFLKKPEIPILCITRENEVKTLSWNRNGIVFTCPFEIVQNAELLGSRIHSVFLLRKEPFRKINKASFTDSAIKSNQSNDMHNLSRYVMELDQKVELLSKVKTRITEICPQVDDPVRTQLISIINAIKVSINNSKLWDDFKLYFEQANPEFLFLLAHKYPNLTPKDLKYCCYLKMNMTNNDIRNLLGINQESVRTHKHRLKKKMTISKDQDLRKYLLSIKA